MDYHVCEWEMLKKQILPACSVLAGEDCAQSWQAE